VATRGEVEEGQRVRGTEEATEVAMSPLIVVDTLELLDRHLGVEPATVL
jgi:hypothetical protein